MIKNMPRWLYEPLPYVYAAMGVVSIVTLDAIVGKISGVMLISAGVVIWHLRFSFRRRRVRPLPKDLSWGHHQRMNPPKNLDSVRLPDRNPPPPPPDPNDF